MVARQDVLSTHECTFTRVNFANSHTPSGNEAMREVEERNLRKNVLLQALPKYDSEGGRTLLPCGHGQLVYRYCQNKSILNKSHVWCGHFTFTIVIVNISNCQPSLSSLVLVPINYTKLCLTDNKPDKQQSLLPFTFILR